MSWQTCAFMKPVGEKDPLTVLRHVYACSCIENVASVFAVAYSDVSLPSWGGGGLGVFPATEMSGVIPMC